jgi:hypothetical protein
MYWKPGVLIASAVLILSFLAIQTEAGVNTGEAKVAARNGAPVLCGGSRWTSLPETCSTDPAERATHPAGRSRFSRKTWLARAQSLTSSTRTVSSGE